MCAVMVPETLVVFNELRRLIAREDFTNHLKPNGNYVYQLI
jgi:hypothetical protein